MQTTGKIASEGCYSDRAIVLHSLKYLNRQLIIHLLTRDHGRMSYITYIRRSTSHANTNVLQPLTIINFNANRTTGSMHRLADCEPSPVLHNIALDIAKSTISLFVSEMMYRLVTQPMDDVNLYDFIEDSIIKLNEMERGVANFHIWFLVHFAYFMGYQFPAEYSENQWLDIKLGTHTGLMPNHQLRISPEYAKIINQFTTTPLEKIDEIKLSRGERKIILSAMIDYYGYHCDTFTSVSSIEILAEVF